MASLVKRPATDQFGNSYSAIRFSDQVNVHLLAAATNESDTVPTGARTVVMSNNLGIWVQKNAVAAVPAADIVDGSAPRFHPPNSRIEYVLDGIATIQFIGVAAETPVVTLEYYG